MSRNYIKPLVDRPVTVRRDEVDETSKKPQYDGFFACLVNLIRGSVTGLISRYIDLYWTDRGCSGMFLDGLIFFSESKKCIMSGDSPNQLPTVTLDGAMTRLAMIERRISA